MPPPGLSAQNPRQSEHIAAVDAEPGGEGVSKVTGSTVGPGDSPAPGALWSNVVTKHGINLPDIMLKSQQPMLRRKGVM